MTRRGGECARSPEPASALARNLLESVSESVREQPVPANSVVPFPSELSTRPESAAPDTPFPASSTEATRPAERASPEDNAVRRAIRELHDLSAASEDIRAGLAALGIPRRVVKVLVEFGVQKQIERQAQAIDGAIEQAEREHGVGAIERTALQARILELVRIEQDRDHARQVARGLGLDPRTLAILSQMIQSNPGDGGERAVTLLLSYARACDIPLDGVPQLSAELTAPAPSVLPRVAREPKEARPPSVRELLRDAVVGLAIGVIVIGLLI